MFPLSRPLALIGAITAAATMLAAPGAHAATGNSVTASISVAPPLVRSVTISPSNTTFSTCQADDGAPVTTTLTLPNGGCTTPTGANGSTPITITNGQAAGHIDASASDATPSDNATPWTLCGGDGPGCTGNSLAPGVDQYQLAARPSYQLADEAPLTGTPACDNAYDENDTSPASGCVAAAGQVGTEYLALQGPSATTDQSDTFSTTVTWTAVP